MTNLKRIGLALLLAGGFSACDGMADGGGATSAAAGGEICYRGQRVWAANVDGVRLVEGDIHVYPEDMWCEGEAGGGDIATGDQNVVGRRDNLRIQGAQYQWPGGVVPYTFDASFTAAVDQPAALAAMKEWSEYVPSIRFVARTTETDYITFVEHASLCESGVGHGANQRTINLTTGCIGSHSLHHEIGHALGLYHQHTRKDRDSFVTVNWGEILGCPAGATQYSDCGQSKCAGNLAGCGCTADTDKKGTCYKAHNFATDTKRANIGGYDYDSVMHYSSGAFSKTGNRTLTVLQNDAAGNPLPIGQRSHLSDGDVYAMRAMYPLLTLPLSMYAGKGSQRICTLVGRTEDIAVRYSMSGSSTGITSAVNSQALNPGTYTVACKVDSSFWASNYNYPNSTTALNTGVTLDSYARSVSMRVMTPALLAVF